MDKNKNQFHQYKNYAPHLTPPDKPKPDHLARINKWLNGHKILVLIVIITIAGGLSGLVSYLFLNLEFAPITASSIKKADPKFYSALTGLEISKEDSKRPVTAAMIENTTEARPQSGLKDAGVIFESVAEGGITRLLALYQEGKPSQIGPVRSVRPQFASWVAAFDAGLAHVGGSDIPLKKLRSGQIKDLDQFFNSKAYTRVSNRRAPHNVYTSDEKLQKLNKQKGYTTSNFTSWKRKSKQTPNQAPNATVVTVPISTGQFAVSYAWDKTTNNYVRTQGGIPHTDREAGQLAPKVVIVIQVPHNVIRDSNNFSYPDVIGSGNAWVFQNGIVTNVAWNKAADKEQLVFKDTAGQSIELNPGQTWISAVRPDKLPAWQ